MTETTVTTSCDEVEPYPPLKQGGVISPLPHSRSSEVSPTKPRGKRTGTRSGIGKGATTTELQPGNSQQDKRTNGHSEPQQDKRT